MVGALSHPLRKLSEVTTAAELFPTSSMPDQPYICVYKGRIWAHYVGIIDFLQPWNFKKDVASCIKCCFARSPYSTVAPPQYLRQFTTLATRFCDQGVPPEVQSAQPGILLVRPANLEPDDAGSAVVRAARPVSKTASQMLDKVCTVQREQKLDPKVQRPPLCKSAVNGASKSLSSSTGNVLKPVKRREVDCSRYQRDAGRPGFEVQLQWAVRRGLLPTDTRRQSLQCR